MKKTKAKKNGAMWLDDQNLASIRMTAIQVASGLAEPEPPMHGMMSGGPGRPGKSADKVVADAEKIMAFVTKR